MKIKRLIEKFVAQFSCRCHAPSARRAYLILSIYLEICDKHAFYFKMYFFDSTLSRLSKEENNRKIHFVAQGTQGLRGTRQRAARTLCVLHINKIPARDNLNTVNSPGAFATT